MTRRRYHMTETALRQLEKIVSDKALKWGFKQATTYNISLLEGLQDIADNHQHFNSLHRDKLARGTSFLVHLVGHHYVVFEPHDKNTIIIVAIFHERMDISTRLNELQNMTKYEISALKRRIKKETTSRIKPY